MWTFKEKSKNTDQLPPGAISFSQLDLAETFGDNLRLTEEAWVQTSPLNERVPDPESQGLP